MKSKYLILCYWLVLLSVSSTLARTPNWYVKSIKIQGNQNVSRRELLDVMELKPKILSKKVRFSDWRLRSDIDAIKKFYKNQGFLGSNVLVTSVIRDSIKSNVSIFLTIYEGKRTVVNTVKLLDKNSILDTAIVRKLSVRTGVNLLSTSISADLDIIKDSLATRGYLDGLVKPIVEVDTLNNKADVVYEIASGPRIKVGYIELAGLKKLKSKYIYRELNFKKGDILTSDRLHQSEENLYRTNLLNSVQIEHAITSSDTQNFEVLSDLACPVVVHLQETDFFKIQTGIGYTYFGSKYKYFEGIRAKLETSYSNLFALGHQIAFSTNLTFPEQKVDLTYSMPWFFGIPLQFESKIYVDRFLHVKCDSATILGEGLQFGYQPNRHLEYKWHFNWENMFNYRGIDTTTQKPRNLTQIIGMDIIYDTRNDIMDPSSALYNILSLNLAGLADTNSNRFFKMTNDLRYYWKYKKVSWATGLSLGLIYTYDKKHPQVSPQEQFYTGGTNVLRGFEQNELHSEKGLKIAANLIEMRFPLFWWFSGALFVDAGNVYENPLNQHIFQDLRWNAGPGIRIKTPLAIIRADLGFKLDKKTDESLYQIHFDIGQPF